MDTKPRKLQERTITILQFTTIQYNHKIFKNNSDVKFRGSLDVTSKEYKSTVKNRLSELLH
jgi:hypothetical protein